MKVSYSGLSEYQSCGMKYYWNRVEKIRPVDYSSAFFFGSAVDAATEAYLLDTGCPFEKFKKEMLESEHNRQKISLPKHEHIRYYSTDLDFNLLCDKDWKLIDEYASEMKVNDFIRPETALDKKVMYGYRRRKLSSSQRKVLNYATWLSLKKKGMMLIEKFCEWADENIEEVIGCQVPIKIGNSDGDILRGFADIKARFKDGVIRIIDVKTARDPIKQYPDGCVETSPQLIIYTEAEGISEAGYFVLDKKIRVREPRVRSRYLEASIPQENADKVFDELEESLALIKAGVFEHNWDACNDYGGCPYRNLCKKGSMKGLVKLEDRSEYSSEKEN